MAIVKPFWANGSSVPESVTKYFFQLNLAMSKVLNWVKLTALPNTPNPPAMKV
jgi:hypothetical protein